MEQCSGIGGGTEVDCITLNSLDYANVGLIKIDVEGWEPNVLAGARSLLAIQRPLILMEWNTLCLVKVHHDPASMANALWSSFEFLGSFFEEKPQPAPQSAYQLIHDNIIHHKSVTDILIRPKIGVRMPALPEMIDAPRNWK